MPTAVMLKIRHPKPRLGRMELWPCIQPDKTYQYFNQSTQHSSFINSKSHGLQDTKMHLCNELYQLDVDEVKLTPGTSRNDLAKNVSKSNSISN